MSVWVWSEMRQSKLLYCALAHKTKVQGPTASHQCFICCAGPAMRTALQTHHSCCWNS